MTRERKSASAPEPQVTVREADSLRLCAPSRLHFGLLSWGRAGRQFGGVGVMVEYPGVELTARSHDRFAACGAHATRVEQFARLWADSQGWTELPPVKLQVVRAPPEHVGLGVGTQLGLSVALLLARWLNLPDPSLDSLAAGVRRGRRSAIGTHGFWHGGLIYERGKQPDEILSPLVEHLTLPATWRFVLIRPAAATIGLHGAGENRAFATLPAVSPDVSDSLVQIAERRLLPAARAGDFVAFGEAVYEFGWRAGMCFAPAQGGPFNGPLVTQLVERLRSWGVTGVGQSSWGPTVFALASDQSSAERLAARLDADDAGPWIVDITPVHNGGAASREP